MYKYTLIVSQYRHSYHFFIVEHDANFLETAKAFAKELILYKRDYEKEMYLGDLETRYRDHSEIHPRYNINDSGDIYFIQSNSAHNLMNEATYYKNMFPKVGNVRKDITLDIAQHHNFGIVNEIVKKHFKLA